MKLILFITLCVAISAAVLFLIFKLGLDLGEWINNKYNRGLSRYNPKEWPGFMAYFVFVIAAIPFCVMMALHAIDVYCANVECIGLLL